MFSLPVQPAASAPNVTCAEEHATPVEIRNRTAAQDFDARCAMIKMTVDIAHSFLREQTLCVRRMKAALKGAIRDGLSKSSGGADLVEILASLRRRERDLRAYQREFRALSEKFDELQSQSQCGQGISSRHDALHVWAMQFNVLQENVLAVGQRLCELVGKVAPQASAGEPPLETLNVTFKIIRPRDALRAAANSRESASASNLNDAEKSQPVTTRGASRCTIL